MEQTALETLSGCPLCRSAALRTVLTVRDHSISQEWFTLQDCDACGFRFTNPRPEPARLGAYYKGENYISHSNAKHTFTDRLYQLARRVALRRKYALIKAHQPHGKALDVGCGTGEFLAYLKSRGYLVTGVEPDLGARESAIANLSLEVLPGIDAVPARGQFQVITLWHVLEHLPEIRSTFKKLHALLSDQGLLVIAVPDRGSWDAAHYGPDWAAYDVPRHLSHFRQQDVKGLLREHGFDLLRVSGMSMDAFYIAMLSERYRGASWGGALTKGILLGGWSDLLALLLNRPESSSLYIARKTPL